MTEAKAKKPRGRGRPRMEADDSPGLVTRDAVIDLAFTLARTQSIDEISFVLLAKHLDVVPGSLHYHLGTKDDLTSAILNRFFHDLHAQLAALPADVPWRERISAAGWTLFRGWRDHRGAAEHIQTRARFRVFQKVREGEIDHGARFLDFMFSLFRSAGFGPDQTALCYHTLAMHCLAAANSGTMRLEPVAHEAFLRDRAAAYPAKDAPGLHFALVRFANIRTDDAFRLGLEALLDRFARERSEQ